MHTSNKNLLILIRHKVAFEGPVCPGICNGSLACKLFFWRSRDLTSSSISATSRAQNRPLPCRAVTKQREKVSQEGERLKILMVSVPKQVQLALGFVVPYLS